MVDKDFMELKKSLIYIFNDINAMLSKGDREGHDNKYLCRAVEGFKDKIVDFIDDIDYMNKEVFEGILIENTRERFEIQGKGKEYTCGAPMEAFVDDELCLGRVEARWEDGKSIYYFLNSDGRNVDLYNGMKVRYRK